MLGAPSAPAVAGGGDWHAIGEASTTLIRSLPEFLCLTQAGAGAAGAGATAGAAVGAAAGASRCTMQQVGERMHLQQPKLKYMHHAAMAWCMYLQQLKRS